MRPADEVNVAAQPVQLGDDDRGCACLATSTDLTSSIHGCREFRPTLQSIGSLASIDFAVLRRDAVAVLCAEHLDCRMLRFPAETAALGNHYVSVRH